MIRTLLPLTLVLFGAAASGEDAGGGMILDPGIGGPTCGAFAGLDMQGRIDMLAGIQPLGDDIDPGDADAARQGADEVARACGGDAHRPLDEAARTALGQ